MTRIIVGSYEHSDGCLSGILSALKWIELENLKSFFERNSS